MTAALFAAVTGRASLFEHLGEQEAAHAIERCLKRMARAIESHQGQVTLTVGDGLQAIFPTPAAACQAAIEMQLRIADLPPVSGHRLSIRVGLHGEPEVQAGEALEALALTAARVARQAPAGQILISASTVAVLGVQAPAHDDFPAAVPLDADGPTGHVPLCRLRWGGEPPLPPPLATPAPARPAAEPEIPKTRAALPSADGDRLRLVYRGRQFILGENSKPLTLGRDLGNQLVIEDRKASRKHALIEHRAKGFVLLDRSTNGTFVTLAGQQEMMLRHDEVLLTGSGRICFGGSANDPKADCADFEPC
jgi:adenylate cyclase